MKDVGRVARFLCTLSLAATAVTAVAGWAVWELRDGSAAAAASPPLAYTGTAFQLRVAAFTFAVLILGCILLAAGRRRRPVLLAALAAALWSAMVVLWRQSY